MTCSQLCNLLPTTVGFSCNRDPIWLDRDRLALQNYWKKKECLKESRNTVPKPEYGHTHYLYFSSHCQILTINLMLHTESSQNKTLRQWTVVILFLPRSARDFHICIGYKWQGFGSWEGRLQGALLWEESKGCPVLDRTDTTWLGNWSTAGQSWANQWSLWHQCENLFKKV